VYLECNPWCPLLGGGVSSDNKPLVDMMSLYSQWELERALSNEIILQVLECLGGVLYALGLYIDP